MRSLIVDPLAPPDVFVQFLQSYSSIIISVQGRQLPGQLFTEDEQFHSWSQFYFLHQTCWFSSWFVAWRRTDCSCPPVYQEHQREPWQQLITNTKMLISRITYDIQTESSFLLSILSRLLNIFLQRAFSSSDRLSSGWFSSPGTSNWIFLGSVTFAPERSSPVSSNSISSFTASISFSFMIILWWGVLQQTTDYTVFCSCGPSDGS